MTITPNTLLRQVNPLGRESDNLQVFGDTQLTTDKGHLITATPDHDYYEPPAEEDGEEPSSIGYISGIHVRITDRHTGRVVSHTTFSFADYAKDWDEHTFVVNAEPPEETELAELRGEIAAYVEAVIG